MMWTIILCSFLFPFSFVISLGVLCDNVENKQQQQQQQWSLLLLIANKTHKRLEVKPNRSQFLEEKLHKVITIRKKAENKPSQHSRESIEVRIDHLLSGWCGVFGEFHDDEPVVEVTAR